MKLKLDENGNVVVENGMPVYETEDGNTVTFDAVSARQKIDSLNAEAKKHRLNFQEQEKAYNELKESIGDLDLDAAKSAMEAVKNFDAESVKKAEEIQRRISETFEADRKQLTAAHKEKMHELETQLNGKNQEIFDLMVSSKFHSSPFFSGENPKTYYQPDDAAQIFGKYFKIEDGRPVGYLNDEKILSRQNYGSVADFDEAIGTIINARPDKDRILRASGGGSGSGGNSGDGTGTVIKAHDADAFSNNLEGIAKGDVTVRY